MVYRGDRNSESRISTSLLYVIVHVHVVLINCFAYSLLFKLIIHSLSLSHAQELVKELIHSKQRLKNAEDELKDVKSYLDNLLLRIMETNPALLSTVSSS